MLCQQNKKIFLAAAMKMMKLSRFWYGLTRQHMATKLFVLSLPLFNSNSKVFANREPGFNYILFNF